MCLVLASTPFVFGLFDVFNCVLIITPGAQSNGLILPPLAAVLVHCSLKSFHTCSSILHRFWLCLLCVFRLFIHDHLFCVGSSQNLHSFRQFIHSHSYILYRSQPYFLCFHHSFHICLCILHRSWPYLRCFFQSFRVRSSVLNEYVCLIIINL